MSKIINLLHEAGINRAYDGWRKPIHTDGPPGLTSLEQELNRFGGSLYGQNALEAITTQIESYEEDIMPYKTDPDDEVSEEILWTREWLQKAKAALAGSRNRRICNARHTR